MMDKHNTEHLVAGKYSIEDLVDLPALERIFEKFSTATGFTTGFLAYPSQKVLIKTGWRDACVKFHRAFPSTVVFCKESNVAPSGHLKEFRELRIRQCRMGLVDGATPIIVRGVYIAYLATGQVFFQSPDLDIYRGYAKQFGFDEADYLKAIQAVPVVSETQFRAVLAYLSELATDIAEQGVLRLEKHEQLVQLRTVITEREQADESLRESRELIDGIINAMPVRVFWKDKNSVYLGCNAEFAHDAGVASPQDIIGKTDAQLAWREFAHLYLADDRQVIDGGKSKLLIEEPLRTSNGTVVIVMTSKIPLRDAQGVINGMLGTYQDITDRKQTEEKLRESETRYQTFIESTTDMAFIKDDAFRYVMVNAANAQFFQRSVADIIGRTDYELVPASAADRCRASDQQALASHQIVVTVEQIATRWYETRKFPLALSGGRTGIGGFVRDITARKFAEDQLRDSNRELEETLAELRRTQRQIIQHENLRVLGQMASGIAHDFNNALAPVIGFSELLLKQPEKLGDREQLVKRLQIINTCASDAARMVRQMRAVGSPHTTSGAFEPLDINKLVRQTIELTQPRWKDQAQSAGQTIHMVTDLLPVPVIYGAEFAIREALTNLIFNAVDAMATGGTITLSTRVDGQFIELLVNDTGGGLTEEVRRRIFEPFFSTKGVGGHGLGLAMVRGVVQQHGGTVEVESRPGQGTTFKIRLPIECGKTAPIEPASSVAGLTRTLRVLVVDDEPMLRTITTAFLTVDGHVFETAASGAEALAQLKAGKFDVVITDKTMPEMNGEQLAAAINQHAPGVPIILMTGFGDMMLDAGEMPPHICTILCKPFTQASLRAALVKTLQAK